MGPFELNNTSTQDETVDEKLNSEELNNEELKREELNEISNGVEASSCTNHNLDPRRIREENIIALKVYDSCRQQECLGHSDLGPARAAECVSICDLTINEGEIIKPPREAAAVSIEKLRIKKVMIVEKQPNSFRRGYWDIDLKYVFVYRLIFREADGCIIGSIKANSIFNKKLTLFGSEGSDLFMSTDLFNTHHESTTLNADPFISVESKAVALEADIKYCHTQCGCHSNNDPCDSSLIRMPREVNITIGIFSIIKLFRLVDLSVQSRGFAIPEECKETCNVDPCEYFDHLAFPMDIFAPPQKSEFFAGISGDIPNSTK